MLSFSNNEVSFKVVPKPEASSYLYSYTSKYLKARIKYDVKNQPHWVNIYQYNTKIWSCSVDYFKNNFERFVEGG